MGLGDEKYMLLTTFRRDGTAVSSPVWVVPVAGDEVGFWTSSGSGKAKRLARDSRVQAQACDARGRTKAGSKVLDGTARLVEGSELEAIGEKVRAKYGFMVRASKFMSVVMGTLRRKRIPYGDRGVIVTLSA